MFEYPSGIGRVAEKVNSAVDGMDKVIEVDVRIARRKEDRFDSVYLHLLIENLFRSVSFAFLSLDALGLPQTWLRGVYEAL